MSVLEAQAMGVPTIASNCGGIPELIDNGYNGFTFSTTDLSGAATAIMQLWNSPAELQNMRNNCIRNSRTFTHTETAKRYLSVYQELGA